jgi:hypothetical protein
MDIKSNETYKLVINMFGKCVGQEAVPLHRPYVLWSFINSSIQYQNNTE